MSLIVGGAAPPPVVVIFKLHPPAKLPTSPAPSSTTYNDHAPLAGWPLNAARLVTYGLAGAGAAKASVVASKFVGLNVPVASGPPSERPAAAASEKVKVTLFGAVPLPASDSNNTFCPVGLTNKTSMSSAHVWLKPRSVTVTLLTVPPIPETLITDGYGVPAPMSEIVIATAFVNDRLPTNN